MDENRFWILAAKKLAGEVTDEELRELDILFISNPAYKSIYANLQNTLVNKTSANFASNDEVLNNLRKKLGQIDKTFAQSIPDTAFLQKKKSIIRFPYMKVMVAASVFLLIAFTAWITLRGNGFSNSAGIASLGNNISTKPGSKTQVKLPDGTLVILNSDSKLSYPDNFLGNTRDVTLEGEAYFDVAHNKQKPFIIHSKTMDVKVLGTVFDVKAYANDATTEASLIKGSIEVTIKNSTQQKIMLKPREKIIVQNAITEDAELNNQQKEDKSSPLISVKDIDYDKADSVATDIAWLQNKLVFSNETFANIAILLERKFAKKIIIKTDSLKHLVFTGKFNDEGINQILKALQLSHRFNYKEENDTITIY
jgi:ferric-dicitrate binding protein FerR (iron transport regulator)